MNLLLKDNKFGFTKFSQCPCAGGGGGGGCSTTSITTEGTINWVISYTSPTGPTGELPSPPEPSQPACSLPQPGGIIGFPWRPNGAPVVSNIRFTVLTTLVGTDIIPSSTEPPGGGSCNPNCQCSSGGGGCVTVPTTRTIDDIFTSDASVQIGINFTVTQNWISSGRSGRRSCTKTASTSTNGTETVIVQGTKTNYRTRIETTNVTTCTC